MEIREHKGFSHGLKPGTTSDINCIACQRENAADRLRAELAEGNARRTQYHAE